MSEQLNLDEGQRELRLLAVMDLLIEADKPLDLDQLQQQLAQKRNLLLTTKELRLLLDWGYHNPDATDAPVRLIHSPQLRVWSYAPKRPLTDAQREAAGSPPFAPHCPTCGLEGQAGFSPDGRPMWYCTKCRAEIEI